MGSFLQMRHSVIIKIVPSDMIMKSALPLITGYWTVKRVRSWRCSRSISEFFFSISVKSLRASVNLEDGPIGFSRLMKELMRRAFGFIGVMKCGCNHFHLLKHYLTING